MKTIKDLISKIRIKINDSSSFEFSDDELLSYIHAGITQLEMLLLSNRVKFNITMLQTQSNICPVPDDLLEIYKVIINDNTIPLKEEYSNSFGYFILNNTGGISVSMPGLQNNNCIVIPGESSGIYTVFNMPFTKDYNGFRATILNTNWGAAKAIGPILATAPSGYYFHEDGETISDLVIEANEGVDIIGIGEGNSFKGWCVLNRFRYGVANSGEGFPLKAIFAGKVEFSGGVPRLTKQKRYNQYWYGAENKKCQLSYMMNAPHYCTISFPSGTFSSADKYTVLLSGELLRSDNGPGVYASVIERTANSFTVYTGDDASWNDGNFTFIVIATHLWE